MIKLQKDFFNRLYGFNEDDNHLFYPVSGGHLIVNPVSKVASLRYASIDDLDCSEATVIRDGNQFFLVVSPKSIYSESITFDKDFEVISLYINQA